MATLNRVRKISTHEGAHAVPIDPLAQLERSVMSCLLWEGEFYEDGQTIADRIADLARRCLLGYDRVIPFLRRGNLMTRTIEVRTQLESLLVERALAMARELELVSDAPPDGQVLAVSQLAALHAGRELTRVALEATLNRQSSPAEKKGRPAEPAPAADRGRAKTKRRGKP